MATQDRIELTKLAAIKKQVVSTPKMQSMKMGYTKVLDGATLTTIQASHD